MDTQKKQSSDSRAGKVLNVVIVVLVLLLFVQCGVYMVRYAGSRRSSQEVPFDMRMLSASSVDAQRRLDAGLLMPEAMAVGEESACRALFSSAAVTEEMYAMVSECLFSAMTGEAVPASLSDWTEAMQSYVYAQYSAELPYQVICAFAAAREGEDELPRSGSLYIGVRELLLCADDTGAFTRVLVRGESGVYSFMLETEQTMAEYVALADVYPDLFCRAELCDMGTYSTLKTSSALTTRVIYTSQGVTTMLTANESFLRLLDFNPDKLNFHVEADGAYVYVESHGTLHAGVDEMMYQASESGGIDVAVLGAENADIYAYLTAASYLIARMEEMNDLYTGGDAALRLDYVESDGLSVTLGFTFRCDNILLTDHGENTALTLTFTGDKLTMLRYRMCIARRGLEERRVSLQSWYRRMLGGEENAPMRLVYAIDSTWDGTVAQWSCFVAESKEKGADDGWDGQN